jgi:hypothetical protein
MVPENFTSLKESSLKTMAMAGNKLWNSTATVMFYINLQLANMYQSVYRKAQSGN